MFVSASAPANPPSQSATIHKQVVSINNDENATTEVKTKKQTSSNTSHVTQPSSKKKRVREQWSIEDKTHFFEAVAVVSMSEWIYTVLANRLYFAVNLVLLGF